MGRHFIIGWLWLAAATGTAWAGDSARASIGGNRLHAGDDVTLEDDTPGNAFLAGGRVHLAGRVAGNAFVTGGAVEVTGSVRRDLYAAGGELDIRGEIGGDVRAAGGNVRITRSAKLGDDATLAGGSVEVEGAVDGDLRVYGDSIVVDGVVGGDLRLAGEDLRIGSGARIAGRLEYRSDGSVAIDPGAAIAGGIVQIDRDERTWLRRIGRGASRVGGAMFSLGIVLLGALLVLGMPAFSREAAATIRREPLQSAGIGFLMLVGVPIAIVVLLITIVGIPLALMLIFGYVVLLLLGYLVAALFVGDAALGRLGAARSASAGWRVLFLLLALVALAILRRLPLIGGLAVLLLFLAGVGAFTMRSWQGIRRQDGRGNATT